MRLIIRKRDSVISIVLFLFNILEEFNGTKELKLSTLIQATTYFGKNETAIRMALSRMVKLGILQNSKIGNETFYFVTEAGLASITEWRDGVNSFLQRYRKRFEKWQGTWYYLVLPDLVRTTEDSRLILEELTEMGMREMSKDIWVSPYSIPTKATDLLGQERVHFEITGNFVGKSSDDILRQLFGLKELREQYQSFIDSAQAASEKIPALKAEGECLPLLFELGWSFYDIATQDPALPQELVKEWEGDTAVRLMTELRGRLFKKAAAFFTQTVNRKE